jgi:hypothetical protein
MSKDQAEKNIDALVLMLDPLAVVRTQTKSRGHRVDVHVDDGSGTGHVEADLSVADAQAFDTRVDALAATVCDRDPRDVDGRRAAAVGAMGFGWDRLPCLCESPDCDAATKPPVDGIVIYMIGHRDAIEASKGGPSGGGPGGGPQDPDGGPGEGPDPDDRPTADLDDGPEDGDIDGEPAPGPDAADAADEAARPADDVESGADGSESGADGSESDDAADGDAAESDDAAAESGNDTEPAADTDTDTAPERPPGPAPHSPPIGDLTTQRRGLVGPAPNLLPKPWYTYSRSALSTALNAARGELCPARPGVIPRRPGRPRPGREPGRDARHDEAGSGHRIERTDPRVDASLLRRDGAQPPLAGHSLAFLSATVVEFES